MVLEIFPFTAYKVLTVENSFCVTARLKVKNPHISSVCFLCVLLITFRMQLQGLMRDHKQQYSFNLDNLVFKWKKAHRQQNTTIPPNHIKECLLVRRLQGMKVNPLKKYKIFLNERKRQGLSLFLSIFFPTEPKFHEKISTKTKNSF